MNRLTEQEIDTFIRLKMLKPYAECADNRCTDGGLSKLFRFLRKDLPSDLWFACVDHDYAYWLGDWSGLTRIHADEILAADIRRTGFEWIARLYFRAVRIGGASWLPTPWRWGFGWRCEPDRIIPTAPSTGNPIRQIDIDAADY